VAFIGDVIQAADIAVTDVVNSQMCSQHCVCPTAAANNWLNKPESYLNGFGRTLKTYAEMNSTDQAKKLTSLVTSNNGTVYTKYIDCQNANNTSNSGALKLIKYFEEKYTCSGICKTPLFYFSLDLSQGIPSSTCLMSLKREVQSSVAFLGVTAIIIGIIMFFVWTCQYCLWRQF
jgi:hypothetical protein